MTGTARRLPFFPSRSPCLSLTPEFLRAASGGESAIDLAAIYQASIYPGALLTAIYLAAIYMAAIYLAAICLAAICLAAIYLAAIRSPHTRPTPKRPAEAKLRKPVCLEDRRDQKPSAHPSPHAGRRATHKSACGKACNTQEPRSTYQYQRRANQISSENEKTCTLTNISAGKEPKPQPHMEDEKATKHMF